MSLQDGEVVDINDPRLAKVRTKVEGVLASAAHDNRIKRQNDAAQKRASKFEEALNSRSTGNNNKK